MILDVLCNFNLKILILYETKKEVVVQMFSIKVEFLRYMCVTLTLEGGFLD